MICSFEISFASGRFHASATAETDRKIEAAALMFRALGELLESPAMLADAFGVSSADLAKALKLAPPEPVTITLPANEAIN